MKKILLLSAAVLSILATASCSKESAGADSVITIIDASIAPSKTALGDKDGSAWPNYWKAGDQIIVNGVTSGALGQEADGNASATFSFSGAISTPYYAAYPAAAVSDYAAGNATITLPASQAYVAGSYDPAAFLMCGTSSDASSVVLTPCVGVFHLSLDGTASINKVKFTAAEDAALSGDFLTDFNADFSPLAVQNTIEMVPDEAVKLPADFFICLPVGLEGALKVEVFDTEGGSMSKNATIKSALVAGQVYAPGTLTYSASYDIEITAEGITSSTAVICWDNSPAAAYTISVYSDAGCSALVDSYAVNAGNACWRGMSPRFCVSGLAPGTTYYVKVSNTTHGAESNVLPVTTEDFEIVMVSSTPADIEDVLLAEDFGELRWDCDMLGVGAGWFPTDEAQKTSFATVEVSSYQAAATSNEKQLSPQLGPLVLSRLGDWAQGANRNMYIHPGYIKLVGSGNVTHIVTPALDNIPEGMMATLEVEVVASAYYSESSSSFCTKNAVVAVQKQNPDEPFNDLLSNETNKLDLSSNVAPITLAEELAWNTYTVTVTGVFKGDRLAFGAAKNVTKNDARMNISSMKVTLKELNAPGDLALALESVTSSTAAFSWNHVGMDAEYDVSKPYTAALYRDADCANLVVSHVFEAGASCWDGKSPCFSFGGLEPSTTYYLRVTNTEDAKVSDVVSATTAPFEVVDATTVTDAGVGDVILAEDFSEIGWGPDEFAVAAGFVPSPKNLIAPSGVNPAGGYDYYNGTGNRLFGTGIDLGDSRLSKGWGFHGNSSTYLRDAYLRVGASGGRTHMVTPKLSGIPAGKVATLEVTITATKYDSGMKIAAFAEKGLTINSTTDTGNAKYKQYTGASFDDGQAFDISTVKSFVTKTVTLEKVDSECQLVIGSLEDNEGKNRFYLKDIVVTIVELSDPGLEASLKAVSSSTAAFSWTYGGDVSADIAKPYTASLYRDAACTDLVVSHTFEAGEDCWYGKTPSFVFGGLDPATEYWFQVTDTENGKVSDPVSATTEAFTVVDATTVTDASVGDVILAEDFSEIGAGPDELVPAAGFVPSSSGKLLPFVPSGADPQGGFVSYRTTSGPYGDRIIGAGWDLGSSRLSKGWGFFGGSACYYGAGCLRLATSSTRTHIVTPALSGIPAGKVAKIEVTVTACKYESNANDVAVFAEKALTMSSVTDPTSGYYKKYTGASLSNGYGLDITAAKIWETKSVTISKVDSDCQLLIGTLEDISGKNRVYISDIVVTILELKDGGAIDTHIEINDFATFKDFLTACEPGKTVQGDLMTDINLTASQLDEIADLYPIADFDGIVNGNNHSINGLVKPLFAKFTGTVSNLTLNSTLNITEAMNNVGILAGYAEDASISNCVTNGSVAFNCESGAAADIFVAGMVGKIKGATMINCVNNAPVVNTTDAGDTSDGVIAMGGISGYASSVAFSKCVNNGAVTNTGLAGSKDTYCRVGGLVGWAVGADLSASGEDQNINYGDVTESSNSKDTAFAGVVAYAEGEVSDLSNSRNEGTITVGGEKKYIFFGGIAGAFANSSLLDNTYNSGKLTADGASMASTGYLRLGGIIGGWFNAACTEQTITGCTNTGAITITSDNFANYSSGAKVDCYVGGIAGGGNNNGVFGKELKNCTNTGNITLNGGSANSGKLYHMFCIGGIIGYTDVNPTGSKCIANIRFRSTKGTNRVGGIAGEMMIEEIHDVTYKGTVNSNGSGGTNFTGLLVGNVGTGERTFTRCTVSGTSHGANSNTLSSGIFFSCNGGGTGPTVNIASCTLGSGTCLQTASSGNYITITSADQITAENVCGTNGSDRTCTTGTNDGLSIVVDPDTITP